MSKAERLIDLIAMLLEARKPVTLERIRACIPGYGQASTAAFKRMFERDKSELREMGIPIRVEPVDPFGDEMGYRIPKEEYYLPEISFTPEEKIALLMVNRLSSGGVIPLSREAAAALLKLSPDLGDASRLGRRGYPPLRFAPQREPLETLTPLLEAVVGRRTVRFAYRSQSEGKRRRRELDPYGLFFERGAWYVVGRCHLRRAIRTFRVSRIESPVELARPGKSGPDFDRPPGFKLEEYSGVRPWELNGGADYEARVRFSPRMAWLVERDLGEVYRFEPGGDGGGILHVKVRSEDAFLNWVLTFAEDAEVLSPPELREKVRGRLLRVLEKLGGEANA